MTQIPKSKFSFGVIILAAGRSTRMGKPKMLLPWGTTTVLGHLINTWSKMGASQIAVVHAGGDRAVQGEMDRLQFPAANRIVNPEPERGMFSSVVCAAGWDGRQRALTHWAIALGDQPHLQPATLEALIYLAASRPAKICQPSCNGHGRHPVILPKSVFKEIAHSKAETLHEFLQARSKAIALIEAEDAGLDLDIDSPEDYEKAVKLFGNDS